MDLKPAWKPSQTIIDHANITKCMKSLSIPSVEAFYQYSINDGPAFWDFTIKQLGIVFKKPYDAICDLSQGITSPSWLPGAKLNIVDSCFTAPKDATAITYQDENNVIHPISYQALDQLSNQVANGLVKQGYSPGDSIAIIMPMNIQAVAIYLGIIKMGGTVVSIAESFSNQEIAIRLSISYTKAIFTQDRVPWGKKQLPLYNKIIESDIPPCFVNVTDKNNSLALRDKDHRLDVMLDQSSEFTSHPLEPMHACNILFSSGTTGTPKAIPWNHTTPIRCASDAFYHQNIQPNDILAWPTSLGWMMGPWLIFASLINHATIALYSGAAKDRAFGEFVQNTNVTLLGLVPTLVAVWRESKCMEGLDWQRIKAFSSSGECSNANDMKYLMQLAGNKPVIEYCGGTEIGGAYLSSTVVTDNYPSLFSTPTMGTNIVLIDEQGKLSTVGEIAIVPPTIGLSTTLLNADHEAVYFKGMPTYEGIPLRRHGDQAEKLSNGYYTVLGRVDDTMKLGGIKTSAAEIERAIVGVPEIVESAAVALQPASGGPSELVIFSVSKRKLNKIDVMKHMQQLINQRLNPLFKIHDVIFLDALPKTASNKIMRRLLRKGITSASQ